MNKLNIVGAALVAGALIAGCGKQDAATDEGGNEVVIEVNGLKLTSGGINSDVEKIIAAQGENIPAEQLEFARQNLRNQIAQSFLIENALVAKAKAEGFVITDDDRKAREESFLKNISGMEEDVRRVPREVPARQGPRAQGVRERHHHRQDAQGGERQA